MVRTIASRRLKSDKIAALMLARLLQAELLPMMWIPGKGSTIGESFFHIGEGRCGLGPQ